MSEVSESGRSSRRSTSLELNLVPFIDLMSVLITFLLITAVWTQVSLIQIGTSIYGQRNQEPPPPIPPRAEVVLKLEIRSNGYLLNLAGQQVRLPLTTGNYDDDQLLVQLDKFKKLYPDKADAAITMSDELPYERLIRGMDLFLRAGFPQISILTGGP